MTLASVIDMLQKCNKRLYFFSVMAAVLLLYIAARPKDYNTMHEDARRAHPVSAILKSSSQIVVKSVDHSEDHVEHLSEPEADGGRFPLSSGDPFTNQDNIILSGMRSNKGALGKPIIASSGATVMTPSQDTLNTGEIHVETIVGVVSLAEMPLATEVKPLTSHEETVPFLRKSSKEVPQSHDGMGDISSSDVTPAKESMTPAWAVAPNDTNPERLARMATACESTGDLDLMDVLREVTDSCIKWACVVDIIHNVMFCGIPKVASTTWIYLLALVTSTAEQRVKLLSDKKNANSIVSFVHRGMNMTSLTRFHYLSEEERFIHQAKDYKYMVVRHPLDRIVSAYEDLIVYRASLRRAGMPLPGRHIYIYAQDLKLDNRTDNVTFQEFIHFIVTQAQKNAPFNVHWIPYHMRCHPCLYRYNYLARLETADEDLHNIWKELNMTDVGDIPILNTHSSHRRPFWEYYTNISSSDLQGLTDIYKRDSQIFGYGMPGESRGS